MLLPDNIHPEQTIYYNGSFVLKELTAAKELDIFDLYSKVSYSLEMSYPIFLLCLDWLYLINLVETDKYGRVKICI